MDEFKKGMTVKLKSGGPRMTVFKIESSLNESVCCQWFFENKLERDSFPPESLKIIKEEQEKWFKRKLRDDVQIRDGNKCHPKLEQYKNDKFVFMDRSYY